MAATYNPALVALSILVSAFAGFTALSLGHRMRDATGSARAAWLCAAAIAMGGGIFSMHFIAMLAFSLDMPMAYDPGLTLLSILLAIGFTGGGLAVVSWRGSSPAPLSIAALLMGLGVVTMHYTGMAAMRMAAHIRYDPLLVAASVGIAVGASAAALWLTFNLPRRLVFQIAASLLFAAAVSGMHYTGMAAAHFHPASSVHVAAEVMSSTPLAVSVGATTFVILLIGLVSAVVDQRVSERARLEADRLRRSEQRFRLLVDGVTDTAIYMLDPDGFVTSWNAGAERITGYSQEEVIGRHFSLFHNSDDIKHGRPDAALAQAVRDGRFEEEGIRVRKSGRTFWALVSLHALRNSDGSLAGFAKITRDISERKAAQEALQRAHDELERKVALRTRELTIAKEAAEAANQSKSQFVANMSHELRTPLNAIIGYSEMLLEDLEGGGGDEQATEDVRRITKAGHHLLGLINEVLDLAKIEAGQMELHVEEIDVRELMLDLAGAVQPLVIGNGNKLSVAVEDGIATMLTDPQKTRQCLLNLLSNAAKFTRDGSIEMTVSRQEIGAAAALAFTVRDTGIGMTDEQLDRIFDAFVQADASTTRLYGGTGLGLTITRQMVELMGGSITVASRLGEGTTFTLRLPQEIRAAAAVPARRPAASEIEPPAILERVPSGPVLVIDDDPQVLDLMERTLTRHGFKVHVVDNGPGGLAMARQLEPVAILLDVKLPTMDGWEILTRLKSDPALVSIPVIMMTMIDDAQRGFTLGASHYLLKPLDTHVLIDTLRNYAGMTASLPEVAE